MQDRLFSVCKMDALKLNDTRLNVNCENLCYIDIQSSQIQ